jgi:hypothetical protein
MTHVKRWLAVPLLLIVALIAAAQPAQANSVKVLLIDKATGRCLTAASLGTTTTQPCNGNTTQNWYRHDLSSNTASYEQENLNWCLITDGTTRIFTLLCASGSPQTWTVTQYGDYWEIKNAATGFCMDSNANGDTYSATCNGGDYQHWKYQK